MKDFFSAKKNLVIAAIIVALCVIVVMTFLGNAGLGCYSCDNCSDRFDVISCVADGCVDCTNCMCG